MPAAAPFLIVSPLPSPRDQIRASAERAMEIACQTVRRVNSGPLIVRCAADHGHLAKPERPERAELESTNILDIFEHRFLISTQVPRAGGRGTTNHGRRGCSKRSTTWICSTGVSGHAHPERGPAIGRGCGRHSDRPFRPRSRRRSSNMNLLLLHDALRTVRCYGRPG